MLIFVKNDDCVSYKMTFHHVFIYLDLVCILYPVCSLQSAFCTDRKYIVIIITKLSEVNDCMTLILKLHLNLFDTEVCYLSYSYYSSN